MGENTQIEWCDHSWSPWTGCTKVSAGCAHCYAEARDKRHLQEKVDHWGKGAPRLLRADSSWKEPMKWDRAAARREAFLEGQGGNKVFPSLCDWLDDEVPIEWLARFLTLIHDTPNLTWLLLTKRPHLWRDRINRAIAVWCDCEWSWKMADYRNWLTKWVDHGIAPRNVWVGTSVEDQANADRRIPRLMEIPAAGRFLSLEPLLGPVDLNIRGRSSGFPKHIRADGSAVGLPIGLHWLIIGGESGHGARPCNVEWVRELVRQGKAAGVPTFVKQLGANVRATNDQGWENMSGDEPTPRTWPTNDPFDVEHNPNGFQEEWQGAPVRVLLSNPKGGDPSEWPEDLRVREFPEGLR